MKHVVEHKNEKKEKRAKGGTHYYMYKGEEGRRKKRSGLNLKSEPFILSKKRGGSSTLNHPTLYYLWSDQEHKTSRPLIIDETILSKRVKKTTNRLY